MSIDKVDVCIREILMKRWYSIAIDYQYDSDSDDDRLDGIDRSIWLTGNRAVIVMALINKKRSRPKLTFDQNIGLRVTTQLTNEELDLIKKLREMARHSYITKKDVKRFRKKPTAESLRELIGVKRLLAKA